ncbi:NAD-dependent succinate-semialdehyde dehydrogenase [Mycobacterium sp. URHB0044]|jgi:succinate-semialdehyde dehydrogenase/glutarate-semialdehyde dehydrogenase|uniref:NAD-dependent succinate-semialdehyde dehydrogenase n=1 Tax=Mycobacterium sp. URHB0044 TaxID=1380386 RepID=UPI00048FB84E|nr:NAD-dependent succinate-semialdehyde dehydrogenase [Mycobacterium sp. URHB0044]
MATYAVINPATGKTVAEYPNITDAEIAGAIGRADEAQRSWKTRPVAERAAIIGKVADLYEERADELGAIITREMGKPITSAIGEAKFTASIYRYYANIADSLLADEPIELLGGNGSAVIRRSPIGVVLGIMPWNYPYYQVSRFGGPNLLVGNTVLLKPAPQCPESAAAMEKIFHEAGVPADAYISVLATNEQVESVIADPRVRGVSLTGSDAAGSAVAELAGRHLKKVVLELGGSDPFILLSTDDLDGIVGSAVGARMGNAGQACNAAKRFIVADGLYDDFVTKFAAKMADRAPGDPRSADTTTGPLSSARAAERLEAQVKKAVDQGATLVLGGTRQGTFFAPTVLTDITPESDAFGQEFFGPVAQVYRAGSEAEAIELANATEFGLGSYVFSTDAEQAQRVADQIEAGMVFINTTDGEGPEVPFGGVKKSGFGRELGRLGAEEFVNKKLIRVG